MKNINLRSKARSLKKNKINTKYLMVELMKISSIDFTVEHMNYKLYKYSFGHCRTAFQWMMELCNENILIFNGWKPEKVDGRLVGSEPVFGLIYGGG